MSDGGKGSSPRPYSVPKEEFDKQFDKIFGEPKSKHCEECGKLPSWCECNGIGIEIQPVENDHLGDAPPKQTDFEVTVKKTWEF